MMMRVKKTAVPFLLSAALLIASGFAIGVVGQETQPPKPAATKKAAGGRDPFRKYEPAPPVVKRTANQVAIPTIEDRITLYKAQKVAAMNARMPAPKPTKLSYVIYPGEPFYDGQLVAIEDNRLVFRRETVFTDGRRQRAVEYKPLRQPTPVNSMTTAPANPSVATAKP